MFFPCPIEGCENLFSSKKAVKDHVRTHKDNRPYTW